MSEKETLEDRITAALKPLMEDVRNESFTPAYRAKINDSELVGDIVSKFFRWDPKSIIKAFLYALEDSNAATLTSQIEKLTKVKI